jgi:hypothetical protein
VTPTIKRESPGDSEEPQAKRVKVEPEVKKEEEEEDSEEEIEFEDV